MAARRRLGASTRGGSPTALTWRSVAAPPGCVSGLPAPPRSCRPAAAVAPAPLAGGPLAPAHLSSLSGPQPLASDLSPDSNLLPVKLLVPWLESMSACPCSTISPFSLQRTGGGHTRADGVIFDQKTSLFTNNYCSSELPHNISPSSLCFATSFPLNGS